MVSTLRRITGTLLFLIILVIGTSGVVLAQEGGEGNLDPASPDCYDPEYYDRGDLPEGDDYNYRTLSSNYGPCHKSSSSSPSLKLGQRWDADDDGNPSSDAQGDDGSRSWLDDEDGVILLDHAAWASKSLCSFEITVTGEDGYTYPVGIWLDWNDDGDFGYYSGGRWHYDTDEFNTAYIEVPEVYGDPIGTKTATVTVPCGGAFTGKGNLYGRFRLYRASTSSFSPAGCVDGGEVEDYRWTFETTAVALTGLSAISGGVPAAGLVVAAGAVFVTVSQRSRRRRDQ
jgi:hypothetical protein